MEKLEKNFERISSYHWSDMSNVSCKVRINRINIFQALLLLFMSKKVKKAMRTRLSGNKITRTEIFVRSKKTCQMKNHLRPKDFSLLWKLANKYPPYKKKRAIFFVCNRNSPFLQLNRFRSLHRHSSNNSENTDHRHLPLTGINHCNSRLSKNINF